MLNRFFSKSLPLAKGLFFDTINIITESIRETDKEILQESVFSKAVKVVKSWISRFLNKGPFLGPYEGSFNHSGVSY